MTPERFMQIYSQIDHVEYDAYLNECFFYYKSSDEEYTCNTLRGKIRDDAVRVEQWVTKNCVSDMVWTQEHE